MDPFHKIHQEWMASKCGDNSLLTPLRRSKSIVNFEVHPQLSNNRHPMDVGLVGIGSL
jgi:hypothetical protein